MLSLSLVVVGCCVMMFGVCPFVIVIVWCRLFDDVFCGWLLCVMCLLLIDLGCCVRLCLLLVVAVCCCFGRLWGLFAVD